jgi:hypothetical protein
MGGLVSPRARARRINNMTSDFVCFVYFVVHQQPHSIRGDLCSSVVKKTSIAIEDCGSDGTSPSQKIAADFLRRVLAPSSPTLLPHGGKGRKCAAEIDPPLAKKTFWRAGVVGLPVNGRRLVARFGGAKRDSLLADHRFDQ